MFARFLAASLQVKCTPTAEPQAPSAWITSTKSRLRVTLLSHARSNSATRRLSASEPWIACVLRRDGPGRPAEKLHRRRSSAGRESLQAGKCRKRLAAFHCGARRVERRLQHEIRGELHVAAFRAQQLGQIIGGGSRVEWGPFFGPACT